MNSLSDLKPKIVEKRWRPDVEVDLIKLWDEEGLYSFNFSKDDSRAIVAIDTPPPYASGKWHVGGAAHYAQIDMIARYLRMKGFNVLAPFYADRNGLPVEVQVEKAYGLNAHELASTPEGRVKFLELCREFLDKAEDEIVSVWRRLGCSFNYWRNGTDSVEYRKITQATFIELYRRGLIYEAERPVNWCPRCRTTLAEAELEYVEKEEYLYYIKFRVKETQDEVVIATTRPELLKSCGAVAYNPRDDRYRKLNKLHVVVPIYNHAVPIIEHEYVDPGFGTGLMMFCSYGDQVDVRVFRELSLKPVIVISSDGRMSSEAGPIAGLKVEDARRRIAEILDGEGLIVKKEFIKHSVPVCWRCKTPIQIIHSREWFLKQLEFKEDLKRLLDEMSFKPEMHKRRLIEWIDSISMDWPITKDRFYATEVPMWRCKKCRSTLIPDPGKYYRPWIEEPPWENCPTCRAPKSELEGEGKVFDTWFDSSISVLYVTGFLRDRDLFEKTFPNTIRPQGIDIVRTWLYYTILRVYQLTGRPAFKWIRLTGMGLDEKGEAMHKSKGNVIDPEPFIEKYGADAFRFWAAASAKLGYDYRFSEQSIRTGLLFATKLWNIARFISSFPKPKEPSVLKPIDRATLAKLGKLINEVDKWYSELDVYTPINELYQFTWNYFASNYVELVKSRAYNRDGKFSKSEQEASWHVLHVVMDAVLRMLAPIMPFVTDSIYRRLYGRSVHIELFPEARDEWLKWDDSLADKLAEVNSTIWSYKKQRGIKLSDSIRGVVLLNKSLEPLIDELVVLHNIDKFKEYVGEPPNGCIRLSSEVCIIED